MPVEEVKLADASLCFQKSNIDSIDDSVKQEVSNLSVAQIYMKKQKDRIQVLLEDNHRLLFMISTLNMELKEVCLDFEA